MKIKVLLGLFLIAVPLGAASAMPVSTFLEKAGRLEKKGPLALLSGDLKLLMNQVKADFASLRTERQAGKAGGKPLAYCPAEKKVEITDKDVMAAMRAVPAAQRPGTETRGALRAMLVRKFPCPG